MAGKLRKLLVMLPIFCFMTASATDTLTVYSQINIYPYYFDTEEGNIGIMPEVLTDMLGDRYGMNYYTLTCETCDENFHPDIICCPADEPVPDGYVKHQLPLQINYVVCFRRGEPVESIFSLSNKKVIIVRNDYPFEPLYHHRTSHILNVASVDEALRILSSGYNDCAVLPLSAVLPVLSENKYKNIDFLPTPYIVKPLAIAVKKGARELDSTVNVTLQNLLSNGEFESISERKADAQAKFRQVTGCVLHNVQRIRGVVVEVDGCQNPSVREQCRADKNFCAVPLRQVQQNREQNVELHNQPEESPRAAHCQAGVGLERVNQQQFEDGLAGAVFGHVVAKCYCEGEKRTDGY